jgi:hypothetical protein
MKRSQELTDKIKMTLDFDEDLEDCFQEELDSSDYIQDRIIDVDIRRIQILPKDQSIKSVQRDFDEEEDIFYEDIEFDEDYLDLIGGYKWDKISRAIIERLKSLGSEEIGWTVPGKSLSFQFHKNRSDAIANWYKNEMRFDPVNIEVL